MYFRKCISPKCMVSKWNTLMCLVWFCLMTYTTGPAEMVTTQNYPLRSVRKSFWIERTRRTRTRTYKTHPIDFPQHTLKRSWHEIILWAVIHRNCNTFFDLQRVCTQNPCWAGCRTEYGGQPVGSLQATFSQNWADPHHSKWVSYGICGN